MHAARDMDDLTREVPVVLTLTAQDLADVGEELAAYHAHFAPLFQRREQRAWAQVYLRGLLLADVPRKNVEARPCVSWAPGRTPRGPSAPCNSSSVKGHGTMPRCWRRISR